MNLAFLTSFSESTLQVAASIGYTHLEIQATSWPVDILADSNSRQRAADEARALLEKYHITISALALYKTNPFSTAAGELLQQFRNLFAFCKELDVEIVATLAGRSARPFEEDLAIWKAAFEPVVREAENQGIRIGLENWPGMGGYPIKGTNLADSPQHWAQLFEAIPNPALGLEFDPSHLVLQSIDYMQALKDFAPRIHHVHAKDTEILPEKLKVAGIYGTGWWRYRLPGRGVVDWVKFIDGVREIGYDGAIAVEHEDPIYSGSRMNEGLALAHRFLSQIV